MFDFLGLPREIRNNIYFYALVRPYDLVPFPTDWQRIERSISIREDQIERDAPTMALLAACKLIHAEGNLAFYNRNRFRLPSAQVNTAMEDPRSIFVQHKADIRHISVSFDCRDCFAPMKERTVRLFLSESRWFKGTHLRRAYDTFFHGPETKDNKEVWMHVAFLSIQDNNALSALRTVVLGKFTRSIS